MLGTETTVKAADPIHGLRRDHPVAKLPHTGVTKEMVLDLCREYSVQFVDMQFVDIFGVLKAVTIPVHKLDEAIDNNVWFDGSSIDGFTRITESDMYLKPDLNTFAVLPWTRHDEDVTARLICDVYMPDGSPFEGCPRGILRRQLERAKDLGLTYNVGPELEFFLFELDENGEPTAIPSDQAGYFDQHMDKALEVRRLMSFALDEMGVEVEALHHEVAEGQSEIDFKYSNALRTADNAMTFKFVLKKIARDLGYYATFMPKPIAGINGSGMHVHQSLADMTSGDNRFYDSESSYYGLSELGLQFMAGQMKHIRAMNAIMNPTVNSYKRLVPGYEAPVNVAWGQRNRSALIRIPRLSPGNVKRGMRCELRCPDPSANPYLAFAIMLAAGLDGIEQKMQAPAPIEENIWHLTPEEMKAKGVTTVSGSLKEALDELEKDSVLREALGEHTYEHFMTAKREEWDAYRLSVSDWELDRYLSA